MPRILHITDTHLVVPPGRVSGRLDTAKLLEECIAAATTALSRIAPVDALLVTGDLSDDGSPESYELFRHIVEPIGVPLLVVPGNHDLREPMRAAFSDLHLFAPSGPLNWVRDVAELRIIGIDTLVEGSGGGTIDDETLAFLKDALSWHGPVLLAMHHPPFMSGIRFMDGIGLTGVDRLREVLEGSRAADIRIVCGHLHLSATGSVGRVPAIVGPSPCSTFQFDLRADAPVGFFLGSGGFMVHDWSSGFRSMHVPSGLGAGPFAF